MIVIGLTGAPGSGKGTIAEYLVQKYDAAQFRFSKALDDILERVYQETSRHNEINIAMKLRELFGDDILAYVLKEDIMKAKPDLAVIDGMRFPAEYEMFKKIPGFKLLSVTTESQERYSRSLKRGEKAGETDLSKEEFDALEKRPAEIHVPEVMNMADATIDNNGSMEDLKKNIDEVIQQWKLK